jgi:hypothetical protein
MHDLTDRNNNSSMVLSSPNRLLNLHPAKLNRTSQQQNLSKKLKVNHTNGGRSTSNEGHTTVRSRLFAIAFSSIISFYFKIRKVIHRYDVL